MKNHGIRNGHGLAAWVLSVCAIIVCLFVGAGVFFVAIGAQNAKTIIRLGEFEIHTQHIGVACIAFGMIVAVILIKPVWAFLGSNSEDVRNTAPADSPVDDGYPDLDQLVQRVQESTYLVVLMDVMSGLIERSENLSQEFKIEEHAKQFRAKYHDSLTRFYVRMNSLLSMNWFHEAAAKHGDLFKRSARF